MEVLSLYRGHFPNNPVHVLPWSNLFFAQDSVVKTRTVLGKQGGATLAWVTLAWVTVVSGSK